MNLRAPFHDRWRTPFILTISYAIISVGVGPAVVIATAGPVETAVAGMGIAIGAVLLTWLWLNAGRQRRHNPTWKPIFLGAAVTAMTVLTMLGYFVLAATDLWSHS